MEGVFVPLGFFAMIVALVYLRQRRRERLLLIEKGMDAKSLETPVSPLVTLKWGIVLAALGLGMLIANALARTVYFRTEEAYFAMLFLFGGASLLIFHFIARKQKTDSEPKQDTD
jgi:hypothetical protein